MPIRLELELVGTPGQQSNEASSGEHGVVGSPSPSPLETAFSAFPGMGPLLEGLKCQCHIRQEGNGGCDFIIDQAEPGMLFQEAVT